MMSHSFLLSVACLAQIFGLKFQDDAPEQLLVEQESVEIFNLVVWQVASQYPSFANEFNTQYLPAKTSFRYYQDKGNLSSIVREMSLVLEEEGVISGAHEAFLQLRPFAFKVDLMRAMALWYQGGIYMDHKILLTEPIRNWIDLDNPKEVMIGLDVDTGCISNGFCEDGEPPLSNGFLFARKPKSPVFALIVKRIVCNVLSQFYGVSHFHISGPWAYRLAFENHKDVLKGVNHRASISVDIRDDGPMNRPYVLKYVFTEDPNRVLAVCDLQLHDDQGESPQRLSRVSLRTSFHDDALLQPRRFFVSQNVSYTKGGTYTVMWRNHCVYCSESCTDEDFDEGCTADDMATLQQQGTSRIGETCSVEL